MNYSFSSIQIANYSFATIQTSNTAAYTATVGSPKLPVLRYFIDVPVDATPTVTVLSESWIHTSLAAQGVPQEIAPVQASLAKLPDAQAAFSMDAAAYTQDAFLPMSTASISVIGEYRGHRVALLEIDPVRYNPATGALRLLTSCSLSISFPGSDMDQTTTVLSRYDAPSFDSLQHSLFKNYGMFDAGTSPKRNEAYLIITADSLASAIQPFASWKINQGYNVTVTLTSNISGSVTKEHIHDYIQNAYDNWSTPPSFILLVGDVEQIPTYYGIETGTATDLYYVTVNGTDYFPDIFIGRFSGTTPDQITAMVEKTLYYEAGHFQNASWIKRGAFMASSDNYQVSEGTHNYVISTYMDTAGYDSDKLYCHTYGANTTQVTEALNSGRSLVVYSGHGATTWWTDGPVFHQYDVNALTNDGMYPFVLSHACLTNQFTVAECFGETWMRAPHKGALAYWGASDVSYWDEDDILEKSMFKAWWDDGIDFACGMTNQALSYLYEYYGGQGRSKYYFEEYNLLGDPSVHIWTEDPYPNYPPYNPDMPSGPTYGIINHTYGFSVMVPNDPEGEKILIQWDFGDGNKTEFLGPYTSGERPSIFYTWQHTGVYFVRVRAMDLNGSLSGWGDPLVVVIGLTPQIEITTVQGGFGFQFTIKNSCNGTLTHIPWSVEFSRGIILFSIKTDGTIDALSWGEEVTVKSGLVVGLGKFSATITVGDASVRVHGFLLGPFILGVDF